MNNYYYNYNQGYEWPEDREIKRQTLKKRFSRVFVALFVYTLIAQFLSTALYIVAAIVMPEEQYQAISGNMLISVAVSCAVQYLVAFPVLFFILRDADKALPREQKKMPAKEFIPMLLIAEILMLAGNWIGTFLNGIIGMFIGQVPENSVSSIVNEVPIPVIFLLMVIIAPIVEELIFRKLMIDRLAIYGDHMAILFSAVAFGLIHANLYQFFYATMLGALLGYVYTKTGNVKHTILIHMIINFFGSIVPLVITDVMKSLALVLESENLIGSGIILQYLPHIMIMIIYLSFQISIIAGGAITLWHYVKTRKLMVSRDKEVNISDVDIIKNGTSNVGAILFLIVSLILSTLSLFLQ